MRQVNDPAMPARPHEMGVAYVDESMRARSSAYILVASCLDPNDVDEIRAELAVLAKPGQRFHWRLSSDKSKARAVDVVARLPARHLVVVGRGLDRHRQERARRHCLRRLLFELAGQEVTRVVIEARTQSLNAKDAKAIDAFRAAQVIGPEITTEHGFPAGPRGDSLLWLPDIVAGAVGADLDSEGRLDDRLAGLIIRVDAGIS